MYYYVIILVYYDSLIMEFKTRCYVAFLNVVVCYCALFTLLFAVQFVLYISMSCFLCGLS